LMVFETVVGNFWTPGIVGIEAEREIKQTSSILSLVKSKVHQEPPSCTSKTNLTRRLAELKRILCQ
jgi:hypothetical protein